MLRSKWGGPKKSVVTQHGAANCRGTWDGPVNHPLVMVLQREKGHSDYGCSPVEQQNTFTIARLASPLRREDLPSIVHRPEHVMGILQKIDERGRVPSTSILQTPFVVGLSLHLRGGWRRDTVSKLNANRDDGNETFVGHEETDMASLTERDDDCQQTCR